jgi:hypothetical protein
MAGLLSSLLMASVAFAADGTPTAPKPGAPNPVKTKHYLPNSLLVVMTDRGQKILQNDLGSLINNLGISYNEAYFSDLKWESEVSYKLDDVNIDPTVKTLILSIRDMLKTWFIGFPLGNVKPAVEIGNSGFQAEFNKFSITTDENLLRQLHKTSGAILVLDLDIKEIDLTASKIRAWDMNAPMMGQAGFDNAQLKVAGGTTSLKMRMPFYVNINDQGLPTFETVGLEQNFDKIDLSFSHSPLILPQIQLVVNGVTYPFNNTAVSKTFDDNMPTILTELRNYLHVFTSSQLPTLLNQKAKQYFVKDLEQVQVLAAPGSTVASNVQFYWGLQLKGIDESQGLDIKLNTFVEDPGNPNSTPIATMSSKQSPLMNSLNKADYDVAIGINEGMINRMLQLSYEKQLYSHVLIDNGIKDPKCDTANSSGFSGAGKYLKLTELPFIRPLGDYNLPKSSSSIPGETFVRIPLSVQVPKGTISGFQSIAIKDGFVISFDLIAKIAKTTDGKSIQIFLWDVDGSSLDIDAKYFNWFGVLKGTVLSYARDEFTKLAKNWRCKNIALPGAVPVPALFGVNFLIDQMVMESTGNLILYMNYADTGASK